MFIKILSALLLLITSSTAFAQVNSDLVVIDLIKKGDSFVLIQESLDLLTNRPGYDNQPSFINDKEIAFSSADNEGNFDIIIYNFETKKFTNLTKSKTQNEYSPRITDCGLYVSAITVEENGKQRLWLYPINFGEPELLYDDIEPVGYYDWYNSKAAMFVLGNPNQMIYPYSKNEVFKISENIGRSIQKRPGTSTIAFVEKGKTEIGKNDSFEIKGFDVDKRSTVTFGKTLPQKEDFIWLDKNTLFMAQNNDLYLKKISNNDWIKIGSIAITTHHTVTRMAYSTKLKKLVMVMERNSGSN
jgi:hypothetical protein